MIDAASVDVGLTGGSIPRSSAVTAHDRQQHGLPGVDHSTCLPRQRQKPHVVPLPFADQPVHL